MFRPVGWSGFLKKYYKKEVSTKQQKMKNVQHFSKKVKAHT